MNKTTKALALLFTAGLVLAGCGQKQDSTATTQAQTTATPTTAAPTTVAQAKTDMPADAKKTVLEASDEAVKATMTLYYKDDVFTITYSYDYTKIDIQKLKETIPGLNLRDDNTLGYSQFKEALINGGYKEKQ